MSATPGHPTAQPYSRAGLLAKLTGAAVLAAGAMLYGQGTSALAALPLGTAGRVMVAGASAPAWSNSLTLTGAISAVGLSSSSGLTISAGTTAVQALTCTSITSGNAIAINTATSASRDLQFTTNGVVRWIFRCNGSAEGGSDTGSDWQLLARTDAGGGIDAPISITRQAGGSMTLTRPITASSGLSVSGGTTALQATTCTTLTSSASDPIRLTGGQGNAYMAFYNGANLRFRQGIQTSEGGSNTGSNWSLYAYDDAGSFLRNALTIARSTGDATFAGGIACTTLTASGNSTIGTAIALGVTARLGVFAPNSNTGPALAMVADSIGRGFYLYSADWVNGSAGVAAYLNTTATGASLSVSTVGGGAYGTLAILSTVASTSTTTGALTVAGGGGFAGTIYAYAGNYARSVNNYSGIDAQNTSNGTAAGARTGVYGDTTASFELICNSTGNTGTRFGLTKASYGELVGRGAALSGIIIGCDSVDKPVIFGINASEVARFTSGVIATGSHTIAYTTQATTTTAASLATAGGLAVAKRTYLGDFVQNLCSDAANAAYNGAGTATLGAGITDAYLGCFAVVPTYNGAFTVTRHNYLDLRTPAGTSTITDAAVMRFDANAGTHKAVDSGTTKTSPGTVTAWVKVNINGTIHYMAAYASKTA